MLALAVGLVSAQDYYVDPQSVREGLRNTWCDNQLSTCPLICLDQGDPSGVQPQSNFCDPESLSYECICDNGEVPNLDEYSLTLPYFMCTEWGTRCVAACAGDNSCSSSCRQDNPCGAQNPSRANTTATSSTASPTASRTNDGTTIFTGSPGGDNEESSSSDANGGNNDDNNSAAAVTMGRTYGLAIVFGTLFAVFAML